MGSGNFLEPGNTPLIQMLQGHFKKQDEKAAAEAKVLSDQQRAEYEANKPDAQVITPVTGAAAGI